MPLSVLVCVVGERTGLEKLAPHVRVFTRILDPSVAQREKYAFLLVLLMSVNGDKLTNQIRLCLRRQNFIYSTVGFVCFCFTQVRDLMHGLFVLLMDLMHGASAELLFYGLRY